MLQRVVQHESGRFPRCGCGAEPHHVVGRGRSSKEPVQFIAAGERHAVQCTRRDCGISTGFHPSLAEAEAEWRSFPQLTLPLAGVRREQVAA